MKRKPKGIYGWAMSHNDVGMKPSIDANGDLNIDGLDKLLETAKPKPGNTTIITCDEELGKTLIANGYKRDGDTYRNF